MPSRQSNPVRVPIEIVEYLDYLKDKLAKLTGIDIKKWTRQHTAKALKLMAMRGTLTKQEAEEIYMGKLGGKKIK